MTAAELAKRSRRLTDSIGRGTSDLYRGTACPNCGSDSPNHTALGCVKRSSSWARHLRRQA